MSEWKEQILDDISEIEMGQSPPGSSCNVIGNGMPLLNGPTEFTLKYPIPVQYTTEPKKTSQKGDILFCVRGSTTGRMNYADIEYAIGRGLAAIRHRKGEKYQPYLKALLDNVLEELLALTSGSVFPNISGSDLRLHKIFTPPLDEQLVIASILSSLDDKIDLLHRQNQTLEQLAETLFRQWFVEEAKEDWEETTLADIAEHLKTNVIPAKIPDQFFSHYSLPAFDEGREPKSERGIEIKSNKYKVEKEVVLISKLNPRTPRIWFVSNEIDDDVSICSTEFQVVKPKEGEWLSFIYCFLKSYEVTQILTGAAGGTSGSHQRVSPQDIFNLSFSKPPDSLLKEYDKITKPSFLKISNNQKQIRTLTQLRDTLLPKLMSGELRVKM